MVNDELLSRAEEIALLGEAHSLYMESKRIENRANSLVERVRASQRVRLAGAAPLKAEGG